MAAPHRRPTAPAHPPARLPTTQQLVKESCTVGLEMDGAAGEENTAALRVTFDPRLKLEFHGSRVTSDAGLLPFLGLDDVLGLTDLAGGALTEDIRTGQNSRQEHLIAQLRQAEACAPSEPHPGLEQWPSLAVTCCEEFGLLGGPLVLTIAVLKRLALTLLVVAAGSGHALLVV